MTTKQLTSSSSKQQQCSGKKENVAPFNAFEEASKLYGQTRTRESLIRNAVAPRILRSGKVFDQRRCSALQQLSALTIKGGTTDGGDGNGDRKLDETIPEEEEVDGEEVDEKEDMSIDASTSNCQIAAEGNRIGEEGLYILEEENEEEEESEESRYDANFGNLEGLKLDKDEEANEEHIVVETNLSQFEKPDEVEKAMGTITVRKQRENVQKVVKCPKKEAPKGKKANKKRAKPANSNAEEHHPAFISPPKVPCPGQDSSIHPSHSSKVSNSVQKAVHWADEQENNALFEVKEFREEKPRRRCTMFHKING